MPQLRTRVAILITVYVSLSLYFNSQVLKGPSGIASAVPSALHPALRNSIIAVDSNVDSNVASNVDSNVDSTGPGPHRRVVIGIPTIARKGNPDYLRRTLVSIQQHGFPMDAVYVMHANDAPHPIFESVRAEFALHLVEPSNQSISIEYTPTRLEDDQVKTALRDSPHQKQWRIREARDWRHLMETMLRTTNADFVVFNQDDGEWIGPYPSPLEPITSLWSTRDGMVSFVFERATLRKFLDWMAVDDRWKEKPIDWTLNDFVKEFGYKMPVHRIVRHIGKIRSIVT